MKRFIALFLVLATFGFIIYKIDFLGLVNKWADYIDSQNEVEIEEVGEEYYEISPEFDSCYNSLDSNQRKLYKVIGSLCEEMPTEPVKVCTDYEASSRDITMAYRAFLNDHPEVFWMPDAYVLSKTEGNGYKKNINIEFDYENEDGEQVTYIVNKENRDKMRDEFTKKVEEIVAQANTYDDEFSREKFFNDYICENTEYYSKDKFVNTAYGCIMNKKALCEGYAKAFKLLCNEVGIECDLIVGKSDGEGHMWNSVNIDDKHSYVDVTWNDSEDFPYLYFNITDEQLIFDHTLSPLYTETPEAEIKAGFSFNFVKRVCSYIGNYYYERVGTVLGDDFEREYGEKAAKAIKEDFENGLSNSDFMLKNERIKNAFLNDEKNFFTNIQKHLNGITIESFVFQRDVLVIYYVANS